MSRRVSDSRKIIELIRIVALEGPLSISELAKKLSQSLNMNIRTARSAIGRLLPLLIKKGAIVELDKIGPRGTKYVDITPKGCDAALFANILGYDEVAETVAKRISEFKRPLAKAIGFIHKEVVDKPELKEESEDEVIQEFFEHLSELGSKSWNDVLEYTLIDPLVYHSHSEFGLSYDILKTIFNAYSRAPRDLKPYILQILEYVANMKEARSKELEEEAMKYRESAERIREFVEKERKRFLTELSRSRRRYPKPQ